LFHNVTSYLHSWILKYILCVMQVAWVSDYSVVWGLFSKLHAVLHKSVTQKIVETVPSIKISHCWTETNEPCLSSSKISISFFRLFILLNLKQLCTNTMKNFWYLYCWFGFDICTTFWPFYSHIVLTTCLIDGTVSSNSQRELWRVHYIVMKIVVMSKHF